MAKVHLKGFSKKFLELKRNEEGEVMLDKNGFVLEGYLRNAATKNGVSDDILVYGKLK